VLKSRKIISFGSGSPEPHIRIADSAPAPAQDSFIKYLENWHFDLTNRIKMDKTSSATMIFSSIKFLQVCDKQKGAGAGAAIRYFGSGSRRQFNFGSWARGPGYTTLFKELT
jgi:hypothetical protein